MKERIMKKYGKAIEDIFKDCDGWWIYLKEGFISSDTGCQTIHEETLKELYDSCSYIEMA